MIAQKSGSWEKNKNSYRPLEINKGELPQSIPSCFYCKKKVHIISECWVLQRKRENKSQGSITCNVSKEPLMPIEIENPNVKVSKSQSDIMEDYKPFITKGFVSLICDKTN